jgi:hypothetical protein
MNLQAACPNKNDDSCKVSCQDPTTPSQCVILDTLLIDGSPCGPFTLFLCAVPSPEANAFLDRLCRLMPKWNVPKRKPSRYCEGNAPFYFMRDLRRSLTDLRLAPGSDNFTGLVCGKLADLNSGHGRRSFVCHYRTLGDNQ